MELGHTHSHTLSLPFHHERVVKGKIRQIKLGLS